MKVLKSLFRSALVRFTTKDLGNPRLFIGIQIEQRGSKVILHQRYIRRVLERFDAPRDPMATPLDPKHPLVDTSESDLLNEGDALDYRAAVGAFAFSLSRLLKFCSRPSVKHAATYLASTQDLGISFVQSGPLSNPYLPLWV
jgi:hypothetical protein